MALKDQPYFPLYVRDFMTDEKLAECSAESTGVYIWLLCMMHKSEPYGTILLKQKDKQTDNQIHNFAIKISKRTPFSIDIIERALEELISEDVIQMHDDCLSQKRMLKDSEISEKRSIAGSRGGSKNKSSSNIKQDDKQNQSKKQANYQANSENEIEYANEIENDIDFNNESMPKNSSSHISKTQDERIDERFDLFWAAYPKKQNKGGAKKSWSRIKPTAELFEKIMTALELAKKSEQWRKDNGQFIPYPSTWLNGERWEDDYSEISPASPPALSDFDPDNPYADWGDEE